MGERTILVCDVCGRPAAETVTIRVGRSNWVKDLCAAHTEEILAGARKPRPGRRPGRLAAASAGAAPAPKRRGRPKGSGSRTGRPTASPPSGAATEAAESTAGAPTS